MDRHARVLVTDGSPSGQTRSTLAAVRALRAGGYVPVVTTSSRRSLAAVSRDCSSVIRVPVADDPDYASSVTAAAHELGALTVLPASDAALLACDFPGGWLVDKRRLGARAAAAGIPTPPGRYFADGTDLAHAVETLELPAVIKVAYKDRVGGEGAELLTGPEAVRPWFDVPDPLVVEPFLDEPMTAVFGIIWGGSLVAVGTQRYLRTWPATCGVSSSAVTVAAPPHIPLDLLPGLLTGYEGIFQAQFVGAHLIDVNPRVYGSLPLAAAAGVNLPALWCDLLRGSEIGPVHVNEGVHYRWIEGDVRWVAEQVRRGEGLGVLSALLPRRKTAHSVWALRDPLPMLHRAAHGLFRGGERLGHLPAGADDDLTQLGLTSREQQLVRRRSHVPGAAGSIPSPASAARRATALPIAERVAELLEGKLRGATLPATWSTDFDLHIDAPVAPPDLHQLESAESAALLPLDGLTARLGSSASGQWLIHAHGRGLARLDVQTDPEPDPAEGVARRWRAGQHIGVRDVLVLRRLRAAGLPLPAGPATVRASRIEAQLGGGLLQGRRTRHGPPSLRRHLRRPRLRPRRVVVAFSGLDGAGKSSQVERLESSLVAAGVPVRVVWSRPGMQLGWLRPLRRTVKRALGDPQEPGVRSIGRGDATTPRSRQGTLGKVWASLLVISYLWSSRLPMAFRRGVVIYDRHLVDALATLRAVYGSSEMAWHRWALRRLLASANLTVLLDVPVDVAAVRKPDVVFSRHLLERQQDVYRRAKDIVPGVLLIDGTRSPDDIGEGILRELLTATGSVQRG